MAEDLVRLRERISADTTGFVFVAKKIQPMLELNETGSILGVILVPLFTMQ